MTERRIPDFFVEQIALGEATDRRRDEAARVLGKAGLESRLEELRRSDEEILGRYPARLMADRIRERADRARRPRLMPARVPVRLTSPRLVVPLAIAAVALLAVVLVPRLAQSVTGPEYTGIKGKPSLQVYREDGGEAVLLSDGERAAQGDRIQVRYLPAGRAYGAIISIDGRGSVTLHYPATAADTTALAPEGAALDYAYVLDDAPAYERFFLVTSQREFSATVALDAARKLARRDAESGSLDLPSGFEQSSILLTKGEK